MSGPGRQYLPALAAAAVVLCAGAGRAAERDTELEKEVAALRAEVAAMKAREDQSWLNQRRAEEVKALIQEVLSDAETRASLAEGGLTAGWNKNFFLASENGNFLLKVSGQSQTRYIHNIADQGEDADENEGGFQQRRTKLTFDGHILDPKFKYEITGAFHRGPDNRFELETARFDYEFADGWTITAGTYKIPFTIEELMSSKRVQAVERSFVHDYFTLDFTQGAHVGWSVDRFKFTAGLHDGSYSRGTEFNGDATEFALAGRGEVLLAGDWSHFSDYQAWSDQPFGLVLGAAIDYERGEHGKGPGIAANGNFPDVIKWTADVRAKLHPVNLFVAYIGQEIRDNDLTELSDAHSIRDATQHGIVVQAGLFMIPDKWDVFGRFEYIDFDGAFYGGGVGSSAGAALSGAANAAAREILAGDDSLSILTLGTNYYFSKHNAKLTFDAVWFLDPMPVNNLGAGMVQSAEDDQLVLRGQFQFLF